VRVLHLTTEFPPVIYGGLGTAVGGLVVASARSGLDVGVLLVGGVLVVGDIAHGGYGKPGPSHLISGEPEEPIAHPSGITFFQIPWHGAVDAAVRIVAKWQPDVIHLHTAWVWPFARAIREQTGLPLIYTVHSVDRAEYELGHEPSHILDHCQDQEEAIWMADRLVALTNNETELLVHYYPASKEKIRVVGNGIDDSSLAQLSAQQAKDGDPALVLYTGRLVERKGIRDLLEAIPPVLREAPQTRFVLAGGPPDRSGEDLKREWLPALCFPYSDQIHFTGWLSQEQLEQWYRLADIQVVPSRYEPFGMVVLEGMLYGLPIIASDLGGPKSILNDGQTGLLFPPRDVHALAAAIVRLIKDSSLRQRLATAGAIDVRQNWLWPHVVGRMRRVYEEAFNVGRYHWPLRDQSVAAMFATSA
jgi:glycogen synthase